MQAEKGHYWHHAVVGLNATGTVQPCICMADLPIFQQFIQICAPSSQHASLPSHCIHSAGKHMIHSYWIFILLKGILASKFYSQVSFKHYKLQEQYQPSGTLQAGTYPYCVENSPGRWLHWGIPHWCDNWMLQWHHEAHVSQDLHLHRGLSQKVHSKLGVNLLSWHIL